MEPKVTSFGAGEKHGFIVCRNSQAFEVRATTLRLSRYAVVFEVYNPYSILQLSEVLSDFKIIINERMVYSGRAVVSNLVNTGILLVCEATLDESWLDVDLFSPISDPNRLRGEFTEFLSDWKKTQTVTAEFKLAVADMQTLLFDLRRWLEQVELRVRSHPTSNSHELQRQVIHHLQPEIDPVLESVFRSFEDATRNVEVASQPSYRVYVKRQLHPLIMCSPFMYRIYNKPLGYAGDYEMVNMILRDPHEGASLFASALNVFILQQAPAVAHRNRVKFLTQRLAEETRRVAKMNRIARILNLGCGPAKEIQDFIALSDLCEYADLDLLDFNSETLNYTSQTIEHLKQTYQRKVVIKYLQRSVHQILKSGLSAGDAGLKYDFVYCAGLFDYLSDRVCKRLMDIFYNAIAPGGLLVATNVDSNNPIRNSMEFIFDWHLIYRDRGQLKQLMPTDASFESTRVRADDTGVNVIMEVRKPT